MMTGSQVAQPMQGSDNRTQSFPRTAIMKNQVFVILTCLPFDLWAALLLHCQQRVIRKGNKEAEELSVRKELTITNNRA